LGHEGAEAEQENQYSKQRVPAKIHRTPVRVTLRDLHVPFENRRRPLFWWGREMIASQKWGSQKWGSSAPEARQQDAGSQGVNVESVQGGPKSYDERPGTSANGFAPSNLVRGGTDCPTSDPRPLFPQPLPASVHSAPSPATFRFTFTFGPAEHVID
jgi:hypothetical protein